MDGRYHWFQRLLLIQAGGVLANALLAALALALPARGLQVGAILTVMATIAVAMLAHVAITVHRKVLHRGFAPP